MVTLEKTHLDIAFIMQTIKRKLRKLSLYYRDWPKPEMLAGMDKRSEGITLLNNGLAKSNFYGVCN